MPLALLSGSTFLAAALALGAAAAGESLPVPAGPWFGGGHEQCGSCHVPGGGASDDGPGAETCLGCHEDVGRSGSDGIVPASYGNDFSGGHIMPSRMYRPRRPQGGKLVQESLDCLTCHNPHGGNGQDTVLRERQGPAILAPSSVADRVSLFCVGCHEDMARFNGTGQGYTRHPIGVRAEVSRKAYLPELPLVDVMGTADPSDDVVACTTCHFVHNGPNQYLLRWDRSIEGRVCGQCHAQGRPRDRVADPGRMARLR